MLEIIEENQPHTNCYTRNSLREIKTISSTVSYLSDEKNKRQQRYSIDIDHLGKSTILRRDGFHSKIDPKTYIFFEIFNENGERIVGAVSPQYLWKVSGCWLDAETFKWCIEIDHDRFDILYYSLSNLTELFGWTISRVIDGPDRKVNEIIDSIELLDEQDGSVHAWFNSTPRVLDSAEFTIRKFSTYYHQSCIWLGSKISFPINCFIEPVKIRWTVEEILSIKMGDFISIKQEWVSSDFVKVSAFAKCTSSKGEKWHQNVYLNFDIKEVNMEFQEEDWDVEGAAGFEEVKIGANGPDVVVLDIFIGSTTVSFNQLCNLQEGSLIEVNNNMLPMVNIRVGTQDIFQGELVRLGEQLIIQVISKVA
jgi:flagellar motor switch/type III secretory pathway protein FliN